MSRYLNSGFVSSVCRGSLLPWLAVLLWLTLIGTNVNAANVSAEPVPRPGKVVSLNICTDQLLMLLADPEQIASITFLATDPVLSAMPERAQAFHLNHGLTEEVLPLMPDLVLASRYAAATTVQMLTRLGYRVEMLEPAFTLADVRDNILRAGLLLAQSQKAEQLVAEMDAHLAAMTVSATGPKPVFTNYEVNGVIAGKYSLIDDLVDHAGYDSLGEKLDIRGAGQISLETLLIASPDLMDLGNAWETSPALASDSLRHPALLHLLARTPQVSIPDAWWQCGLPISVNVISLLVEARP